MELKRALEDKKWERRLEVLEHTLFHYKMNMHTCNFELQPPSLAACIARGNNTNNLSEARIKIIKDIK